MGNCWKVAELYLQYIDTDLQLISMCIMLVGKRKLFKDTAEKTLIVINSKKEPELICDISDWKDYKGRHFTVSHVHFNTCMQHLIIRKQCFYWPAAVKGQHTLSHAIIITIIIMSGWLFLSILSVTSVSPSFPWKCSALVCFEVWNTPRLLQCGMECNSVQLKIENKYQAVCPRAETSD